MADDGGAIIGTDTVERIGIETGVVGPSPTHQMSKRYSRSRMDILFCLNDVWKKDA